MLQLQGVYQLLSEWPGWASVMVLCAITILPIQTMRNHFEGMPYQVAWSALFGDVGLAFIMLIAIGVLQRGVVYYESSGLGVQLFAGFLGLLVGILWLRFDWNTQWADRYHHIVVVPLLVFMMITLLPIIFTRGRRGEIITTICLLALWGILFRLDVSQKRMNQREWLKEHTSIVFKNE